ncbi:hypothetical protein C0W35_17090 [Photobacterium kishitanii]|uniref:DUF2971 domain-containing protein n=1 Tax=Photobacterium kishitanii TaxID=318456 RepID=UPI000D15A1A5|nr:DUF2971 domain-containing protein [Photobacterium kishitanii]PSU90591.1 hypothetical protein C0W35_17090 [Photobacterium kishitanii]
MFLLLYVKYIQLIVDDFMIDSCADIHPEDPDAQYNLAICYQNGIGVTASEEKALKWYLAAANLNHVDAQCNLGVCYENGYGVIASEEEAVKWYLAAANLNHADAQFNLAVCYEKGNGVTASMEEAVKWYLAAANQNHTSAQFNLALCYHTSKSDLASIEDALRWYLIAAEQNCANAQYNLALCYQYGYGVIVSEEEAVKWYIAAANQNHIRAQYNLALCYLNGVGVTASAEEAVKWSLAAAKQNHTSAQFNLAIFYENGNGVTASEEEAVKWYLAAANQNHTSAQFNLGFCYKYGKGVIPSESESISWFKKAYNNGDHQAFRYLPHPSIGKYIYPLLDEYEYSYTCKFKDAFEQLQNCIISIMDSCQYKDKLPVFHFTKWVAIQSMLPKEQSSNKNVVRLYHEDYMNDPNEGKSFLELLVNIDKLDPLFDAKNLMKNVLTLHKEMTSNSATYMASFTKSSDRLDLWRAYGSDGDGFCIKVNINTSDLYRWSQAKEFTNLEYKQNSEPSYMVYNVQYDQETKDKCLNELLEAINPLVVLLDELSSEIKDEVMKSVYYMLGEIIYLFKDEQYSSEHEVRIFERRSLNEVNIDESEIGKLYGTTAPILFQGTDSEIIIGPKVKDKRAVELSLKKRLLINGHFDTQVSHSKLEYR